MERFAFFVSRLEKPAIGFLDALHLAGLKIELLPHDLILMYHSIESEPTSFHYGIQLKYFEQHLAYLKKHFHIVSLDDLFSGKPSRSARVALTFDDAYADFAENAFPLLQRWQAPATVFVPTAFIEAEQTLSEYERFDFIKQHLTWRQMRDLQGSGLVSFGLHSHSHRDSTLDLTLLEEETHLGINLFQEKLGYRPRFFAYPYGVRTPQTDQILADAGFEKLFCSQSAYVHSGFVQGRFDVYKRNQELAYFKLTAAGLINSELKHAYRSLPKKNQTAQHPV